MAKRTRISSFTEMDMFSIRAAARNIINLPEFSNADRADVEQELALGLFRESVHFRSRICSWKTFRWKLLAQLSGKIKRDRMKCSARYMIPPAHSLNEPTVRDGNFPDETPTLMDAVTNEHTLADGTESDGTTRLGLIIDVQTFVSQLPADLQAVCTALMDLGNQRDAAMVLHVTQGTISNKIKQIRQLMIQAGLDVYLPCGKGEAQAHKQTVF